MGARKPDPAIPGFAADPFLIRFASRFDHFQSVVSLALDLIGFAIAEIIQALPADAENAPHGVHPEIAKVIGNNGKNKVIKQTVMLGDVSDLVVFQSGHPGQQPRPDGAVTVLKNPMHVVPGKTFGHRPLLTGSILHPENSIDGGEPEGTIPPGGQVVNPDEWGRLTVLERIRDELGSADPE